MKWADRSDSPAELVAFFSMVDWRKTLHRRACEWSRDYPEIFLSRDRCHTRAWSSRWRSAACRLRSSPRETPRRLRSPRSGASSSRVCRTMRRQESASQERREVRRRAIETLMARLESSDGQDPVETRQRATAIDRRDPGSSRGRHDAGDSEPLTGSHIVHRFDTEGHDPITARSRARVARAQRQLAVGHERCLRPNLQIVRVRHPLGHDVTPAGPRATDCPPSGPSIRERVQAGRRPGSATDRFVIRRI